MGVACPGCRYPLPPACSQQFQRHALPAMAKPRTTSSNTQRQLNGRDDPVQPHSHTAPEWHVAVLLNVVQVVDEAGRKFSLHGPVILATGGYANDHTSSSLLAQWVPHLKDMPTTNGPWATGEVCGCERHCRACVWGRWGGGGVRTSCGAYTLASAQLRASRGTAGGIPMPDVRLRTREGIVRCSWSPPDCRSADCAAGGSCAACLLTDVAAVRYPWSVGCGKQTRASWGEY